MQKTFKTSQASEEDRPGIDYHLLAFKPGIPDEKFPLVLVMHGRGNHGDDTLRVWQKEAERRGVMILAPTRRHAYGNDLDDLRVFYSLVDEIARRWPVDRRRISLAGVSSGALIACWLLGQRPEFWKSVVFIASPPYPELYEDLGSKHFPPVLFVHGRHDRQFSFKTIRENAEKFRRAGAPVSLAAVWEGGHEHHPQTNRKIFDWLEKSWDAEAKKTPAVVFEKIQENAEK